MKRIKSCSTLRLKAHQLLNEEEREVFKYAIRNYRKNQSVDVLCEIISKIITDSNRSCLISLIADMLKEEQKSQFLHRCYSKLPGFNLSQNHLAQSEFQVNKDFKSSNLSLRVATFVSKNRLSQSKSNYHLDQTTTPFDDGGSTLKLNNDTRKKYSDPINKKNSLIHSESEELLKTIEKCNRKERPTLSCLKDKGFWSCNNDSATDDESSNSFSSIQEKGVKNNKNGGKTTKIKETPRFYSNIRNSNLELYNGDQHKQRLYSDIKRTPKEKEKSKLMVCKLHFSSVNILKESPENVENISVSTQSTVVSVFHSNSFDDIFIEYNLPLFSEISPTISPMMSIFHPRPYESQPIIQKSNRIHNYNYLSNSVETFHQIKESEKKTIISNERSADQECQTYFVSTCDSSTQTFLA